MTSDSFARMPAWCMILVAILSASGFAAGPDAAAVIANAVNTFAGVKDFTATLEAEIHMERVQIPRMNATMYFKKPDKVHFESTQFLMMPREGVAMNPAVLQERYVPSSIVSDTADGRPVYKLLLAAKESSARLRQMYVWIDPANWTVVKVQTVPYEGRTLTLIFRYALIDNAYWLPSELVATYGTTAPEEKSRNDLLDMKSDMMDETRRSFMRSGSITVFYTDYKVNTGLSDSIFEKNNQDATQKDAH